MADETIIQNLISRLGQSQDERLPAELRPRFVDVDERTPEDLLRFSRDLARFVRHHGYTLHDGVEAIGEPETWEPFFSGGGDLLASSDGAVPPHLALLAAFLDLYDRYPRQTINRITERHLDFYYREVLRFVKKPAFPDRAHVLLELKKGSPSVLVTPAHRFSAGKDVYAPVRETVIGPARIDSLRSIAVRDGKVLCGPVASSSETWRPFGHADLPAARIGFAVSSPVLRMAEGDRKVTLRLALAALGANHPLIGTLEAYLTGAKGWLGPYEVTATGGVLDVKLPPSEPAVVDHDPAIHLSAYPADAPVLQILLKRTAAARYPELKELALRLAGLSVEVSGITSLALESDAGRLDPKKAFLPFGPQPAVGSRFRVGYPEALSKNLAKLNLTIDWQGDVAKLASRYQNYLADSIGDGYFTVRVEQRSGLPLFQPVLDVQHAGSGFITLELEKDFLHETYRRKTIENALKYGKEPGAPLVVLNEPYTPVIQGISLSYTTQVSWGVRLFHAGCFGQMPAPGTTSVPLFPQYDNEGEFLVGMTGLRPGDSVSVLFQAAEGSADPDLDRFPVEWHVLCSNRWKKMESREVVLDTTRQLLTSGIITFVLPAEATADNTLLPAGRIWLKAAVLRNVDAISRLVAVAANAVEVGRLDQGSAPLPPGKIAKPKTPIAAVKSVAQPFASFGGRPPETAAALDARAAERLRHKNRCITPWDYERVVLEAFPGVHKVKCIPHAKDGSWLAPGHVLVIVVPDLRNENARDRLRPRVDSATIERIEEHLRARAGMGVVLDVKNPAYQKIRLDFKVRFHAGFDPNHYKGVLDEALIRFLSPWAYDASRPISFGGRIYKSVLLDFVDELAYVDYVTDFKMFSFTGDVPATLDLQEARAQRPDAILVSDSSHAIEAI